MARTMPDYVATSADDAADDRDAPPWAASRREPPARYRPPEPPDEPDEPGGRAAAAFQQCSGTGHVRGRAVRPVTFS